MLQSSEIGKAIAEKQQIEYETPHAPFRSNLQICDVDFPPCAVVAHEVAYAETKRVMQNCFHTLNHEKPTLFIRAMRTDAQAAVNVLLGDGEKTIFQLSTSGHSNHQAYQQPGRYEVKPLSLYPEIPQAHGTRNHQID